MKKAFVCVAVLCCLKVSAQDKYNIVPLPVKLAEGKGSFLLDDKTVLIATGAAKETALLFNSYLKSLGLKELPIDSKKKKRSAKKYILFSVYTSHQSPVQEAPEGYELLVNPDSIIFSAGSTSGLFYGIQTLKQLFPADEIELNYPLSIPSLSIADYPRFPYRGMHFDVARHFFPVEFVKKYIDYLAMYKLNTFHWHLTDDQGWRIEIKKYPLLTQTGSCRAQTLIGPYGTNKYDGKKYCGFYTQEEIKEVVKYAAERYITVIPEIEMPGHALAALASYPYLGCTKGPYKTAETWGVFDDVFCAGNDSTFIFLQNVLDEVMELFPSRLIHIGGDESPKTRWKTCPDCQRRIATEQLKDEHELQSYFITRIEKYLNSKGRNIIGWDEILEGGLAPNATVMSWRGEDGGIQAARQHHNVVMTPGNYLYFDHSQRSNEDSITFGGYNPLEKVYSYEPVPKALAPEEGKYISGAQANLWTEYVTNPAKVEYQLFPRIAALSEVLWSPKEKRNLQDFERRLPVLFKRLQAAKINYSKAYYDLQTKVIRLPWNKIGWELKSKDQTNKIVFSSAMSGGIYKEPVLINESAKYKAAITDQNNLAVSNWVEQEFFINKATGKNIALTTEPSASYAGSGSFTLVDGVQNNTGMSRSSQFLGFSGDHLEATIDLGKSQPVNEITLHIFEQTASWIYRPASVNFYASRNGEVYELLQSVRNTEPGRHLLYQFSKPINARYIKIFAENAGIIPDGKPGAGNKAWLFADEIEVK